MRKLTPAEMVTALRCCNTPGGKCSDCPVRAECAEGSAGEIYLAAADMIEELAGQNQDAEPEPAGKITYKVKIDTSAVDALEEKVDRINEKLKEAISLAGEIASMSGTCSLTFD